MKMDARRFAGLVLVVAMALAPCRAGEAKRKVIIDQDCRGPATTDLQAVLVLVQSPQTQVLGITVVSGDQWRDEEVAHTLRLLELIGRTDIPVIPGAVFPLVRSQEETRRWEALHGRVTYKGAWNERRVGPNAPAPHGPFEVPPLPEGSPVTKPAEEDAAHFLVRMARQYPHEVAIYCGGPLTDVALAIAIDPQFPELVKELVVMGGSVNPVTSDPEFVGAPRREFNFWWDPEAARKVLRAPWPKITLTTVDISIRTRLNPQLVAEISQAQTPVARYLARWAHSEYMWDELAAAAWLDPSLITRQQQLYVDCNLDPGAGYGDTLVWRPGEQPGLGEQLVTVQQDLDTAKFYRMFVDLMTRPTPQAKPLQPAPD